MAYVGLEHDANQINVALHVSFSPLLVPPRLTAVCSNGMTPAGPCINGICGTGTRCESNQCCPTCKSLPALSATTFDSCVLKWYVPSRSVYQWHMWDWNTMRIKSMLPYM